MAIICPTITAYNPHTYRAQMERIQDFAKRIHIDLMDGEFAPSKSPELNQVWWPEHLVADIHLMYQRPMEHVDKLIELYPNLVVVPFEATIDHAFFAKQMQASGIKAGVALLQTTSVETATEAISKYDHVMVFSGNLGEHGGAADLSLLDKVRQIRQQFPNIEISWDGGINDQNARQLVEAGVDVLNTGGFIQKADDPLQAYQILLKDLRLSGQR